MPEARSTERLESALWALGAALRFPPTPQIARTVTARIQADRLARPGRPPFPGLVLWPRRRLLVLATAGVLLLGGAAAAARLAVGAIAIRVVPQLPTPRPTISETGAALGPTVSLAEACGSAGFPLLLPRELGPPAEAHLAKSVLGYRIVALVWMPDAAHPPIAGTPWGAILMGLPGGDSELAFKELAVGGTIAPVRVGAIDGFWVAGSHDLVLRTPTGQRRLVVTGNVLLWRVGRTTLRLETALGRRAAVALARSVG